jgi:metal-sulfur cluster biosynthetic enzyme
MTDYPTDPLWTALRDVYDPETGINVVDLGLILAIERADAEVVVLMTLTTPFCPAGDAITGGVERRLAGEPDVPAVRVALTFDPPWTPARISDTGRADLGWG